MHAAGVPVAQIEAGQGASILGSRRRLAYAVGCIALDALAVNKARPAGVQSPSAAEARRHLVHVVGLGVVLR